MNVYDFDKTIYDGDSTTDFYFFTLKRHKKMLRFVPSLFVAFVGYYVFNKGNKTQLKENLYRFLTVCTEQDIIDFWAENEKKVKSWYLSQKNDDDLIISASSEFLLTPICEKLGVSLIASKVSFETGKYDGKNCNNIEKVNRFKETYGDMEIDEFYSDSYSDEPIALLSKKAFIVNKNKITPWDFTKHKKARL